MMKAQRPAHRPRGLSSRCLRIFPKTAAAGYYVQIGLDLYDRVGQPARVQIELRDGGWQLVPVHSRGYKVVALPHNVPRFTLGQERFETLNLGTGQYPALVLGGKFLF
jgi:hypothetical protein